MSQSKKNKLKSAVIYSILWKTILGDHVIMRFTAKLFAAAICALLVWEIMLRVFVESYPGTRPDEYLVRVMNKGYRLQGTEGFSLTHYNSLGMRDEEVVAKEDGEFRVLVLGDSITEGVQVNDSKTFSSKLESTLNSRSGRNVNVINSGYSGTSPAYYDQLSVYFLKRTNPDMTVIQISDSDFTIEMINPSEVYSYKETNSETYKIVMNREYASTNPLTKIFRKFIFLDQISTLRVAAQKSGELLNNKQETSGTTLKKINEDLCLFALQQLKQKYDNLVLVHVPLIENYKEKDIPTDAEVVINSMADKINLPILNMREDFSEYIENSHQMVQGFNNTTPGIGHLNKAGHRIIANRIADYIESRMGL